MVYAKVLKEHPVTKDILIENNSFVLDDSSDSLKQKVREKLLLFQGEWFLNKTVGLPFFQLILGRKRIPYPVRKFFIEIIESVEGIKSVVSLKMVIVNRNLEVSFIANTSEGETIQEQLEFEV